LDFFEGLGKNPLILSLESEAYFGLDDVGTRIWLQLTTQPTIQDAYDALLNEYEVEPDVLQADVSKLVTELVAAGLLEITNG